ncbi:hypothetical protein SBADM41S_08062 [Streptomyces badius]
MSSRFFSLILDVRDVLRANGVPVSSPSGD